MDNQPSDNRNVRTDAGIITIGVIIANFILQNHRNTVNDKRKQSLRLC
jgi:hypothetical protein